MAKKPSSERLNLSAPLSQILAQKAVRIVVARLVKTGADHSEPTARADIGHDSRTCTVLARERSRQEPSIANCGFRRLACIRLCRSNCAPVQVLGCQEGGRRSDRDEIAQGGLAEVKRRHRSLHCKSTLCSGAWPTLGVKVGQGESCYSAVEVSRRLPLQMAANASRPIPRSTRALGSGMKKKYSCGEEGLTGVRISTSEKFIP